MREEGTVVDQQSDMTCSMKSVRKPPSVNNSIPE